MKFLRAFLFALMVSAFFTPQVQAQSDSDVANMAEFLYKMVAGEGEEGYPTGMEGPEGGLLGIINGIFSSLNTGLTNGGYTTCASLPSTGSTSMTESGGTFTMTFGTAAKAIPTGYQGAGETYEKAVTVDLNGTVFMYTEFTCATNSIYLNFNTTNVMSDNDTYNRQFEVYAEQITDSNKITMEFYMSAVNKTDAALFEKMFITFSTANGSAFEIDVARVAKESSGANTQGFHVAVNGDTSDSSGQATVAYEEDTDGTPDSTTLRENLAAVKCVTLATEAVTNGACTGLAISEAGTPIDTDVLAAFHIDATNDISLSSLPSN